MPIPPGLCRLLLIVVILLAGGCGADTYRSRLDNTAQYFAYQQKLREELGPPRSESGVTIQPPKQFRWIEPPPPAVDENGEPVADDAAEDPRQPHYLGLEFPGLLGAWEASVDAEVGGQDEPRKAYLYLLGNHQRHLQSGNRTGFHEDPQTFLGDLEVLLSGTIGVVLPEGHSGSGTRKNERYEEVVPRVEPNSRFAPRRHFTAITLSPQIDVGELELPFEMQLYEWDGQQIQVALLMVYPQSISPRERLQERLLLALETLKVDDVVPTRAAQPGAAPAGGGTIAF